VGHGRRSERARAGAGVAATTSAMRPAQRGRLPERAREAAGAGTGGGRAGAGVGDVAGVAREATAEWRRRRRGAAMAAEKFGSLPASLGILARGT
jgi:hypothetical protein